MKKFNSNVDVAFKEFKNQSKCCICEHVQTTASLHFHHINPSHKISEVGKFIEDRDYYGTIAELTKCAILCANCHSLYHSSSDIIKKIMKDKFVPINIDSFVNVCRDYEAIGGTDEAKQIDIDVMKRIISLEEKVRTLEHLLRGQTATKKPAQTLKATSESVKVEISFPKGKFEIDESLVISVFLDTQSLNKTTQAVFGKDKRGAFYINKIKPILQKNGLLN